MTDPKPKAERLVFDFETNAWVLPDAFNTRAVGREVALPERETAPAPGRWIKPPDAERASAWSILAAWSGIGLVVAAIVTHSFLAPTLGLPLVAFFGALQAIRREGGTRPTREDLRLLESPDDPDVCLVALTIAHDGGTVGRDRGVAWFEGGRLLYSGHRTSFALGGEDVVPQAGFEGYGLALRVPRGTAGIRLVPLDRRDAAGERQAMRFGKALTAFRRRPPSSRGPRQWPPLEP